jgi:translation initiation factor IF-2
VDHAKAAQVPIVVALNKADKPQANIDRVKKQLMELGLTSEDWGGKTIAVPVSAKTGQGIDELLEMLLLEAEMLELKANPARLAKGVVIEAELSKGSGPVATLLVQNGTLKVGNIIVSGVNYGKIRAMFNDRGQRVNEAPPSMPIEVSGLSGVPLAGEAFYVVEDERKAKEIVELRQRKLADKQASLKRHITLEDLYQQIKDGKTNELKIILKADVQGSIEALKDSLERLSTEEVKLKIIHAGVGEINESDIMLAIASDAIVIGFHVDKSPKAQAMAEEEKVDVRIYRIIYEVISDIKAAMEGLLAPHIEEILLGRAEVRQVFKLSKAGMVAGSFVTKGKISRQAQVIRLVREGKKVFEGRLSSLKRFKDDVREVAENFECGIGLEGCSDIKIGDIIEVYQIEKTARRL